MKKLSEWRRAWVAGLWLVLLGMSAAQAMPVDMVISTPDEARAFAQDSAPYVFAGQALAVHSSLATERPVHLQSLAGVMVSEGVHFALNGPVSATAAPRSAPLEKRGLGALALSAENTYNSNTVLREGRLQLAGAAALGNPLYNLEQHAGTALLFDEGARLSNFVQINETRPGDQPLPGLAEAVEWRVTGGDATISSRINGSVPIRKTGAGRLRLQGLLMGQPDFFIQAGALAVDGAAAATFWVQDGARLEGAGSFLHARVEAGGMLAPGGPGSVAVLNAMGNVGFEPGSIFHVNAWEDGRADRLSVDGTAHLDGLVQAHAGEGDWASEQRYPILTAEGGLAGSRFAEVESNLVFLNPTLEYEPNAVYLRLTRNEVDAGDVADTPEDKDVADAIDPPDSRPSVPTRPARPRPPSIEPPEPVEETPAPPRPEPVDPAPPVADVRPLTPLQQALQGTSATQARALFRQSSGRWHASLQSLLLEDGRHVRQAVLAGGRDAWAEAGRQSEAAGSGLRTWGQAYAARGWRAASGGATADDYSSRGVVLGLDAPASAHWRPGLVLAAQHLRANGPAGSASGRADTLHAGVSAHGQWGAWRLTAAVLRSWHRIDSRRRVRAGPVQESLHSAYMGRSWQAVLEITPRLRGLLPYLRHEWMRLELPAHAESGGVFAHAVEAVTQHMHATTLGGRLRHEWQAEDGPSWLEAELGWRRVWGDGRVYSSQRFLSNQQAGPVFASEGQGLRRNALALTLEAGMVPHRNTRLTLRYAGLYGSGLREHAAWADLRWIF